MRVRREATMTSLIARRDLKRAGVTRFFAAKKNPSASKRFLLGNIPWTWQRYTWSREYCLSSFNTSLRLGGYHGGRRAYRHGARAWYSSTDSTQTAGCDLGYRQCLCHRRCCPLLPFAGTFTRGMASSRRWCRVGFSRCYCRHCLRRLCNTLTLLGTRSK